MSTNYGRDTSCTSGVKFGRLVSGARLVAEAAYRRLTTPRGTLRGGEDEANYGIDLADMIGSASTANGAAALPGRVRAELLKDERITGATATVTRSQEGPAEAWDVIIVGQTDEGPFTLAVQISEVTVELLRIAV